MLEEDDLELLEENMGRSFRKNRLTRLRRGGADSPPAASGKRRNVVESSDEDLDHDNTMPPAHDIQQIWDDGRDEEDSDGLDTFIESDEPEEGPGEGNERERQKRNAYKQQKRRSRGAPPEFAGIDAK